MVQNISVVSVKTGFEVLLFFRKISTGMNRSILILPWISEFSILMLSALCLDKLGQLNSIEFSWILINCSFYGNRRNSGLALYLKMIVLLTTISVPNYMLVSKSAQFTWNFELCRQTTLIYITTLYSNTNYILLEYGTSYFSPKNSCIRLKILLFFWHS